MKPRIFIIHGWGGSPERDWMPWAKRALKEKGFEVFVPEMPDTDYPKIEPWVGKLKEVIRQPKPSDILIGHSIGCQTILRYLETLPKDTKVKKVILVAPWMSLTNQSEEEKQIAKPWEETPIDFDKVKTKADSFIAIFSDNDSWVPYEENRKIFEEKLGAEIISKHQMGHFTGEEGFPEIPFLLELI